MVFYAILSIQDMVIQIQDVFRAYNGKHSGDHHRTFQIIVSFVCASLLPDDSLGGFTNPHYAFGRPDESTLVLQSQQMTRWPGETVEEIFTD